MKTVATILSIAVLLVLSPERATAETGSELAARLSAVQKGNSFARLRLTVRDSSGTKKTSLQVQIKESKTEGSTEVLYQILWPKEQLGESVLLTQSESGSPSGHCFVLPQQLSSLKASEMDRSLFDSDLAYQDIIENFFEWKDQTIVGSEKVMGVNCQILVSKPGKGQSSAYGSVRAWIDPDRLIPLQIEKYDRSGSLVRRIDTTKVHKNDNGQHIAATLKVHRSDSDTVTELEGSRHRANVSYDDTTFTVTKMRDLNPPPR